MLTFTNISSLAEDAKIFREWIEPHFMIDTSNPGTSTPVRSNADGHCAVVAYVVSRVFGGEMISVILGDGSHWFNRIIIGSGLAVDMDLTGDQFGLAKVRIELADSMYLQPPMIRREHEIDTDTMRRIKLFAKRAHINLN